MYAHSDTVGSEDASDAILFFVNHLYVEDTYADDGVLEAALHHVHGGTVNGALCERWRAPVRGKVQHGMCGEDFHFGAV
jgi:hypothetical protein